MSPAVKKKRRKLPDGWMGKSSRKWLAEQAGQSERIIEIGCWLGRSTKVLAAATPGTVWAVDHWQGTPDDPAQHEKLYATDLAGRNIFAEFSRNLRREIRAGRVLPLRMSSAEAAFRLATEFGHDAFDFVFIDGDHSYEGCAADIDAYRPLVKEGGLLAGHDHHWPGVAQAVAERFGTTITLGPGSIWSVRCTG